MTISEENSRQVTEALLKIADGLNTVAKVIATTKEEDSKKRVKAKKDPNAPRRNLTSYIYFSQEQREKVVGENPSLNAKDVARVMGERWNNLTDDEKAPYINLAEADKRRFQKESDAYKAKSEGNETKPKEDTKPEPKKVIKAEKENKKTNKQAPAAVEEPPKKKAKNNNDKKKFKNKAK